MKKINMNNIDKQYQSLLQQYKTARNNFQYHAMKVTYGEKRDREINTERANNWDSIIKDLRNKIMSYE
jgi:hypothetical protein